MRSPRLVAITPDRIGDFRPWIRALADEGLPAIVLRVPRMRSEDLYTLAAYARDHVEHVAVHAKHPEATPIARALGVSVHLPARAKPSRGVGFSVSCHSCDDVENACSAGALFTFLSPIWTPTSKPSDTRSPLGLSSYLACAMRWRALALGGVTPARFKELRRAGGHGAGVLGGLFGTGTPDDARVRLRRYLEAD